MLDCKGAGIPRTAGDKPKAVLPRVQRKVRVMHPNANGLAFVFVKHPLMGGHALNDLATAAVENVDRQVGTGHAGFHGERKIEVDIIAVFHNAV